MFTHGACYQLFLILRVLHPEAELFYQPNPGHVWTKINGAFYDIRGKRLRRPKGARKTTVKRLGQPHRWKKRLAMVMDVTILCKLALKDAARGRY